MKKQFRSFAFLLTLSFSVFTLIQAAEKNIDTLTLEDNIQELREMENFRLISQQQKPLPPYRDNTQLLKRIDAEIQHLKNDIKRQQQ